MARKKKMTDKQKRFCDEYLKDLDSIRAYMVYDPPISAGCTPDFAARGYVFTEDNRNEYIRKLRKLCKKRIDNLGIATDNVGGLSIYARSSYILKNWDEVEAEYYAYHRKR